jgi:hypothetical protein
MCYLRAVLVGDPQDDPQVTAPPRNNTFTVQGGRQAARKKIIRLSKAEKNYVAVLYSLEPTHNCIFELCIAVVAERFSIVGFRAGL